MCLRRCQGRGELQTSHVPYPRTLPLFSGQVKLDMRALREALGFQRQLEGCKHEVMIAANVGTWERSCVCFVDAGFEALGCPDEVYLVVTLPVPGCDPARQRNARLLSQTNNGIGKCWQG